jgi:hypothetical protein
MADELTRRQRNALVALLSEPNRREAAKACKIPERTLYRWLQQPAFRQAYREASHQLLDDATGRLRGACGLAMDALIDALDPHTTLSARLKAASIVLDLAVKVQTDDLAARLDALEAAALTAKTFGA